MDQVTASGTGASGLGTPAARWALIAVWMLGVAHGAIEGTAGPADAAAYAVLLLGALVLTRRGDRVLSRVDASLVSLSAVVAAILVVGARPVDGAVWLVDFSSYLVALLIARGSWIEGSAGAVALVAGVVVAASLRGTGAEGLAAVLVTPGVAFVVGFIWLGVLRRIVARERRNRTAAAAQARAIRIAGETTERMSAQLREIRAEVAPLLERLVEDEEVDDALRRELSTAEASVRDRVRSPELAHPALRRAVADCRGRDVSVVLLGAESGGEEVIDDALARAVAALLQPVRHGAVTVRVLPPGRAAAISVLVSQPEHVERIMLGRAGDVLERR